MKSVTVIPHALSARWRALVPERPGGMLAGEAETRCPASVLSGARGRAPSRRRCATAGWRAFTLVELILVMAIMATMMAVVAPSLSRSMKARNLKQEARRFIALTEYSRQEAVSLGVPMLVWLDPADGRYGVTAKAGFTIPPNRERTFTLHSDLRFEMTEGRDVQGLKLAAQFLPDGVPDTESVASLRIIDRSTDALAIAKTADGWGYEVVEEER